MEVNVSKMPPSNSPTASPPAHLEMLRRGLRPSPTRSSPPAATAPSPIPPSWPRLGFEPAAMPRARPAAAPVGARRADPAPALYVYRPDAPRSFDEKDKGRAARRHLPAAGRQVRDAQGRGHAPGLPAALPRRRSATRPSRSGSPRARRRPTPWPRTGLCALALLGVWNWRGQQRPGRPHRPGRLGVGRPQGPRRAHRLRLRRHAQARGAPRRCDRLTRLPAATAAPAWPPSTCPPAPDGAQAGRRRLPGRRPHRRRAGGAGRGAAAAARGRRPRWWSCWMLSRRPSAPAAGPDRRPRLRRRLAPRARHPDREP